MCCLGSALNLPDGRSSSMLRRFKPRRLTAPLSSHPLLAIRWLQNWLVECHWVTNASNSKDDTTEKPLLSTAGCGLARSLQCLSSA